MTAQAPPAFGGYLAGTEGIRGSLSLLIVWYHCYLFTGPEGPPTTGWLYNYGISRWQLGLSAFFILSAFLLYRPFVQSILRGKARPAFGAYLANRALRIFPAYWTILTLTAVAGATIVWVPRHEIDFHLPTFLANLGLVHGLHPSGVQTGVPPSWSLAVEWVFYLLLPLMVLLALRIGGRSPSLRRRRLAVLAPAGLLLLLGLAGREAARLTVTPEDPHGVLSTWHAVIDKSFLPWADLFAVGMVIALLRVELEDGRLRLPRHWRPVALAGAAAVALVAVWAQARGRLEWHHYNAVMGIPLGLFFGAVVLFEGNPKRDRLMRICTWRPFVFLGNMSLSIYLIHYPVIVVLLERADVFQPGYAGMAFNWLFVTAIVLPLAYLSHRFIELPFMRRKVRTKAPGPPPPEAGVPVGAVAPELSRA